MKPRRPNRREATRRLSTLFVPSAVRGSDVAARRPALTRNHVAPIAARAARAMREGTGFQKRCARRVSERAFAHRQHRERVAPLREHTIIACFLHLRMAIVHSCGRHRRHRSPVLRCTAQAAISSFESEHADPKASPQGGEARVERQMKLLVRLRRTERRRGVSGLTGGTPRPWDVVPVAHLGAALNVEDAAMEERLPQADWGRENCRYCRAALDHAVRDDRI